MSTPVTVEDESLASVWTCWAFGAVLVMKYRPNELPDFLRITLREVATQMILTRIKFTRW